MSKCLYVKTCLLDIGIHLFVQPAPEQFADYLVQEVMLPLKFVMKINKFLVCLHGEYWIKI